MPSSRQRRQGRAPACRDCRRPRALAGLRLQDVADQRGGGRLAVGAGDADEARAVGWARASSSMSPMMGQPARIAPLPRPDAASGRCGECRAKHQRRGLRPVAAGEIDCRQPRACASARAVALSSQAQTSAPLAVSARAAARPDLPRPSTATARRRCIGDADRSSSSSPQLQRREADQRQDRRR